MIPPDVANNLRLLLPDQSRIAAEQPRNQPVAPAQRITDVLGDLQPGQRLLAEVQALLPNGSYRAVIAQREITLALPFSAKAGDSLELEVVESDGNVALAFVANRSPTVDTGKTPESVSTRLSQAGRLIGDLLGEIDNQGKRAPPAPLNGSRPLVDSMPASGTELAPVLKQALTQSGMFYEAHQARWLAGELTTRQLLQEPQGRFSQPVLPAATTGPAADLGAPAPVPTPGLAINLPAAPETPPAPAPTLAGNALAAEAPPAATPGAPTTPEPPAPARPAAGESAAPPAATQVEQTLRKAFGLNETPTAPPPGPSPAPSGGTAPVASQGMPAALAPLVQQQLDALATQSFAWQGQVWPGQSMFWEITADSEGQRAGGEDDERTWQTRLKLDLPLLGGIEARLRLRPGQGVEIDIVAAQPAGETRLGEQAAALQAQFEAAGLRLEQLSIRHGATPE